MPELAPRIDVHRYAALAADPSLAARLGVTDRQRTSLLAHPAYDPKFPAVVTLTQGDRHLARIGLFPGRIRVDGQEFPLAWGTNWSQAPDTKAGAGAGLLLMRAVREGGSFGGWGISQAAFPIYKAAKFETASLERRMLVLRSRSVLRKRTGSEFAARVGSFPADTMLKIASRALLSRLSSKGFTSERVDRFDASVDAVELESHAGVWFPRGHAELNWAIAHPWLGDDARHRWTAIVLRESNAVVGYALLRSRYFETASSAGYRDLTLGSILRFNASPRVPGSQEVLLRACVEHLREDVDAIELCTGNALLLGLARRIGMVRVGDLRVGVKLSGEARAAFAQRPRALENADVDAGEGDAIFS